MKALILEPDRTIARCISDMLEQHNIRSKTASSADEAIKISDDINPDVVISELSLPGHSGTEFLYEFRTHPDWMDTPLIIYSSLIPSTEITNSNDWDLLKIYRYLYKPDASLEKLVKTVVEANEK